MLGLGLACCLLLGRSFAAEAATPRKTEPLEWDYTTGVLWHIGGGATPLSYTLVPQILSVKLPPLIERPWQDGMLVLRSRISLLLEPIIRGPEHHYIGLAAGGELEWRSGRFAAFFSAGGGFGGMDSKGYEIPGGQGQDFNFNWYVHTGARYRADETWTWSLGVFFQHISNRGLDPINPGMNALGPTLGISRRF
jgi:lipid A 3-O-deacylase